ncbi:MAG: CBS domain-containing protein, partial [Halobacteriales archaeon]|nr:CBS domain-containing protein [Halobacteriales archaeon]
VRKLRGAFEDPTLKAVLVTDDDTVEGVITRRQLASSREHPEEKAGSVVWPVSRVSPHTDVREVARLMVGSDAKVLPVVDGDDLVGVVTADAVLDLVRDYLDVITVADVHTADLVTANPDATLGEVLHLLRDERITHLPVVEGADVVGVISLYDVLQFTTRQVTTSQGGQGGGFDAHGGEGSSSAYRTHGGFGSREGDRTRLLDIPAADVMTTPAVTITPDVELGAAVDRMADHETSSLVVVDEDDDPIGIVTKTDILESLTWESDSRRGVQINGIDLLDDMTYDGVAAMIDDLAKLYGDMRVLEAKVHLHEHDETLRGVPLILARIRLYTDKGLFIAEDEGYGARHALHLARNALERQILEGKEYGRSKKHPDEEYWNRLFGWWLSG